MIIIDGVKDCPGCRGTGQYCSTWPRHFSPCGECGGTGKVRNYISVPDQPLETEKETTMTTQNIFEYATRNKLRFASIRGELSVEQLWDVPLRSRDDFNLNAVAKTVNKALKEISEESFVETTKTVAHTRLETALEIVKYVIETMLAEEETAKKRAANKQEKEKLLAILAEKQAGKLSELSEKELQKRIAALDD